jgi:hypothetical protein
VDGTVVSLNCYWVTLLRESQPRRIVAAAADDRPPADILGHHGDPVRHQGIQAHRRGVVDGPDAHFSTRLLSVSAT